MDDTRRIARAACAALALAIALPPGAVLAHGKAHVETEGDASTPPSAAQRPEKVAAVAANAASAGKGTHDARGYFTDTVLLDQEGRRVQFYSDVLKDRVVLLNVVYTHCEDACPLITHKLTEVRDALGEPVARKVHFVSISSDPERDTPEALKAFAAKNGAEDPNWTFLTGDKASVDFVLARLGQLGQSVEGHSTLLIAGDVAAKRWSKIRPDAPSAAIAERLKLLTEPFAGPAAGR